MDGVRRCRDAGHVDAQYTAHNWFYAGLCGLEEDEVRALALLKKAANAGHADALTTLGNWHYAGIVVEENAKRPLNFIKKQSKPALLKPQLELANCYLTGEGVEEDEQTAIEIMRGAAKIRCPSNENDGHLL